MSGDTNPGGKVLRGNRIWRFVAFLGPTVILLGGCFALFVLPNFQRLAVMGRMENCRSNLKAIASAVRQYSDDYGCYPPAYTVNSAGERLHSWRTLILPYLGEGALYRQIDLSQPWDAPANRKARETAVSHYRCQSATGPAHHTTYLAIVTPHSLLRSDRPLPKSDVAAGPESLVFAIEVAAKHGVPWMEPQDLDEQQYCQLGVSDAASHSGHDGYMILFAASLNGEREAVRTESTREERLKQINVTAMKAVDGD